MTSASLQLQQVLRRHKLSLTKPRQLIYEQLSHSEPLTMQELIGKCLKSVDPASVYRTIALFEKLGIVQRLQIGWKYKLELSNAYQDHHHHLTCTMCGNTTPLPEDQQLERRMLDLARSQNFQPEDHQLEIRGLCYNCQLL